MADFQVPISTGTQNGGSIIRPASYTGVFAIKPTLNAISPEGVKVVAFSIDTCGLFARSMEDLQLLADVFRLPEAQSKPVPLEEARIAFIKTPIWLLAGPGTIAAMEKAAEIMRKNGVQVEEVELPPELNDANVLRQTQKVVLHSEARSAFLMDYLLGTDGTKMSPKIRAFADNLGNFTGEELVEAVDRYAAFRSTFDKFAAKYTAVISPSAQNIAPLGIWDMGDSSFNFLWSVCSLQTTKGRLQLTDISRDYPLLSFMCPRLLDNTVYPSGCRSLQAGSKISIFSKSSRLSASLSWLKAAGIPPKRLLDRDCERNCTSALRAASHNMTFGRP